MSAFDGPEKILEEGRRRPGRMVLILLLAAIGIYIASYVAERAKRAANEPTAQPASTTSLPPTTTTIPATTKKSVICTLSESARPIMPPGFDRGNPDLCAEWLNINDDEFCDYCRFVNGNPWKLRCTLGTADGLVGLTSDDVVLSGGPPYAKMCKWVDFQDNGIPALRSVVGDNKERVSFTPVKVSADGKTIEIGPTRVY